METIRASNKEGKIQCTNCKCWRNPEDYIGKKGNTVKRCTKCREKDSRQKDKPHIREIRNERGKEKKYYVAYREKKREENEEAYLAHNAEMARKWRENNKEHFLQWNKNNPKQRIGSIKHQAKVKNIPWSELMTNEVCENMIKKPCFYCALLPTDKLNGIDRMDNNKGYFLENCVPCCKNCNFIKKSLDPQTFIKRCQHISWGQGGKGMEHIDVWRDCNTCSFSMYQKRANTKNIPFKLSQEMYNAYLKKPCHYCNKKKSMNHRNGIDRKNNNEGYNSLNCVSCCSECNQMKSNLDKDEFIDHCKRVADYTMEIPLNLPEIPACHYVINKRVVN